MRLPIICRYVCVRAGIDYPLIHTFNHVVIHAFNHIMRQSPIHKCKHVRIQREFSAIASQADRQARIVCGGENEMRTKRRLPRDWLHSSVFWSNFRPFRILLSRTRWYTCMVESRLFPRQACCSRSSRPHGCIPGWLDWPYHVSNQVCVHAWRNHVVERIFPDCVTTGLSRPYCLQTDGPSSDQRSFSCAVDKESFPEHITQSRMFGHVRTHWYMGTWRLPCWRVVHPHW